MTPSGIETVTFRLVAQCLQITTKLNCLTSYFITPPRQYRMLTFHWLINSRQVHLLDIIVWRQLAQSSNNDYSFFCLLHNQYQLWTALNVQCYGVLIDILHFFLFHGRTPGPETHYFPNPSLAPSGTTCTPIKQVSSLCAVTKCATAACSSNQRHESRH
jgi:hypothetical protein